MIFCHQVLLPKCLVSRRLMTLGIFLSYKNNQSILLRWNQVLLDFHQAHFDPEDSLPGRNTPSLYNIEFSEQDIIKAIGEISSTAAARPDRYPAILFKKCQTALSKPLIWRKSLDYGEIPPLLKMANIIPVHKGDSRGIPKNYRPIALTSHL